MELLAFSCIDALRCTKFFTFHLAGFVGGANFTNCKTGLGVTANFLPTKARRGSSAENFVHLVHVQLDSVMADITELNTSQCVQFARHNDV